MLKINAKNGPFLDAFIKRMETDGRSSVMLYDTIRHKSWCINFVISQLRQYETDVLGTTVMDDKQLKHFAEEAVDEYYLFSSLRTTNDIRDFAVQLFKKFDDIANKIKQCER